MAGLYYALERFYPCQPTLYSLLCQTCYVAAQSFGSYRTGSTTTAEPCFCAPQKTPPTLSPLPCSFATQFQVAEVFTVGDQRPISSHRNLSCQALASAAVKACFGLACTCHATRFAGEPSLLELNVFWRCGRGAGASRHPHHPCLLKIHQSHTYLVTPASDSKLMSLTAQFGL